MQKKPSKLTLKENYREKALQKNYHFILQKGKFRGQILHATRVIREMQDNHELGPLETLVLGHAYMAVLVMAANLKDQGRIQLDINCDGPIGGLSVEADKHGSVRGYLKHNPIPLKEELTSLDLAPLFGNGTMKVTRLEDKSKSPYSSTVHLKYGNLGQDIASYYLESEQIPSQINLSINFGKDGEVLAAGALFLQIMPGTDEDELDKLEKAAANLPSLGESYAQGTQPQEYIQAFLGEFSPEV
jgi:molecular chaperone Hsp33